MKIRRKQRQTRTHAIKWLLLVMTVAFCFVAYQGVRGMLHVVDDWTKNVPSLENTDAFNFAQDSNMFAANQTTMLAKFQLENRDPVTYEQISPYVLEGTIDTEDVRFYGHNGVDPAGIARALVNNLKGGALEGASTITQQLVRNTVLSQEANDISFERKIREAQLAIDLEKKYTKDQILVLYLNTINYGDGCYGIEAAAQNYFQVSALDLTLVQAATLVGIPQSPTYLNPKENPKASIERRNVVLDRMFTAGDITQEERDIAQAQELELNPAPAAPDEGIYAYPYFTSYVSSLLQAENNPYNVSHGDLFEGGLSIYTTLDTDMQDKAEAACATQRDRMDSNLEAALVAVDPATGQIKAMVGGRDYNSSKVNLATGTAGGGSGRQPGSTFKAFTLAAAIQQGINPQTLIDCSSPMTVGADTFENFDNANYGIMSIQKATALSSNTGFIRLTQQVSPGAVAQMANQTGIITPLDPVLSITLGTTAVSPLEMASAYGTFATGGVKRNPIAITKVVRKDGTILYEAPDTSERVLTEEVAGAVTKTLRTVFESGGTAAGATPWNGQPVAGKTGTSDLFVDHWLVGYAPQLSCATWIGNPAGNLRTDSSLNCNALWQDFMSAALEGQEIVKFPETKDPEYKNAFNTDQQKKYAEKTDPDATKNDLAKAPSVVGKTLTEATTLLNGYKAGYVTQYSDTVPEGVVISQSVQGDQLVLVVSGGPQPA